MTRRSLLTAAASLCACGGGGRAAPSEVAMPEGASPAHRPTPPTPAGPPNTAEVRRDAPFTCAAAHPSEPLFATGTMRAGSTDWTGQVVAWDLAEGVPTGVTTHEHGFGFEPRPGMLQWSPDGRRIAVAASTNEIAVLEPGGELSLFAPDETRDHPVEFCWVDDGSLFASAWDQRGDATTGGGALLTLRDSKTRWLSRAVAPVALIRPTSARDARAVVGHDVRDVLVLDPTGKRLTSRQPLPRAFADGRSLTAWSPDGSLGLFAPPAIEQRYERATGRNSGGRTVLSVFDVSTPTTLREIEVPGEVVAIRFARDDGRFVVVSRTQWDGASHCTIFDGERRLATFDADLLRPSYAVPDASCAALSPDGERLALLRRDGTIAVTSTRGDERAAWAAPRGVEELGLLFPTAERVVAFGPRHLGVFDPSGRSVLAVDLDDADG